MVKMENQELGKNRSTEKSLVGLPNWQPTNRDYRYKYPGDNGKLGDTWRGVETSTKTGETDQGVTNSPIPFFSKLINEHTI